MMMSEDDPNGQSVSVYELSSEKPPSQQVVERVGEESNTPLVPDAETDPDHSLPPLHSVVDADALDTLVGSNPAPNARIEFSYHGYTVTICADRPTPVIQLQAHTQPSTLCSSASAGD